MSIIRIPNTQSSIDTIPIPIRTPNVQSSRDARSPPNHPILYWCHACTNPDTQFPKFSKCVRRISRKDQYTSPNLPAPNCLPRLCEYVSRYLIPSQYQPRYPNTQYPISACVENQSHIDVFYRYPIISHPSLLIRPWGRIYRSLSGRRRETNEGIRA